LNITLKVQETLKGDPRDSARFAFNSYQGDLRYEAWRRAGTEMLLFLIRNPEHYGESELETALITKRYRLAPRDFGRATYLLRLGQPVPEERTDIVPPSAIFNMKFDVLSDPKQIVDATRGSVLAERNQKPRPAGHRIELPGDIMRWSGQSGDANVLEVPVDSRLEAMAREMIFSAEQIRSTRGEGPGKREQLKAVEEYYRKKLDAATSDDQRLRAQVERDTQWRGTSNSLRYSGIIALRHFKSDQNIAMLKPLLQVPEWHLQRLADSTEVKKVYFIRRAAYDTLREWGETIETPILEEAMSSQPGTPR
jgi:hypothetical protein